MTITEAERQKAKNVPTESAAETEDGPQEGQKEAEVWELRPKSRVTVQNKRISQILGRGGDQCFSSLCGWTACTNVRYITVLFSGFHIAVIWLKLIKSPCQVRFRWGVEPWHAFTLYLLFIKVIQVFSMVSFLKAFNTKFIYLLHHSDLDVLFTILVES